MTPQTLPRMGPLVGLLLCLLPASLHAQQTTTASRIDRVVERLEALAESDHAPGMGLAVVTPDGIHVRGIGLADLESETPVTPDTTFEIGSTTKTFTAVLTAMLVDEDAMSFDDPVRDHLEIFHLFDQDADEKVTVRDLLSHRTGLGRTDMLLAARDGIRLDEIIVQLAKAEPMAPFRSAFLYNNQMFMIAGEACRTAAGSDDWRSLVAERVFQPLGMDSTTAVTEEGLAHTPHSSGYKWLGDEEQFDLVPTVGIRHSEAAGSIWSCPRDMARYLSFLLAQGVADDGEALLSKERFEQDLWKPHNNMGPGAAYGLGFMLGKWNDMKVVEHGGNVDGFTSMMALLPEQGIGFSLLINCSMSPLQEKSKAVVFETLLGLEADPALAQATDEAPGLPREELEAYIGDWELAQANQIWTTSIRDDGKLAVEIPGQGDLELLWPDEEGKWALAAAPDAAQVRFEKAGAEVSTLILHQGPVVLELPRKIAEGLPSVEEVLAKMQATVPEERVAELLPLRMRGEVRMVNQGLTGEITIWYQDEDHFRTDLDFGKFGKIVTVVNGDQGWTDAGLQGRQQMSSKEREEAMLGAGFSTPADRLEDFASMRVLKVEEKDGETLWYFKVVPKIGQPAVHQVDAATGEVRRTEGAVSIGEVGAIPLTTKFGEYADFEGLRLPKVTSISNPANGTTVMTMEALDKKVEIPAGLWDDV